ncbi:N-acetylglucosamine-6-sulfatase isoform X2 [Ixodes scapularis]|uniref:N-acetylglucosamine-6-sulfatase isoform X2 n=1 Tax=Ixodes scapularis TaxID=6945 RepID=UPI001A9E9D01|nr:N-acetylglucosamine-6-sulfatase isoform X2 [Ixodes scapularis]
MEILHLFAVLLTVRFSSVPWSNAQPDGKPNIVFILADDLDEELGGMKPLLKTRLLLEDGGMQFTNAYVTTPLCCPSRASILTGRYAHNAFVRNNTLAGNCSSTQWQRWTEQLNFAVDLQRAGYETFYAGKYLNQYGHKSAGGVEHVPPGWDSWNALVGNSVYYNYTLSVNGVPEHYGDNPFKDYLTDVISEKAANFLRPRTNQSKPFFMFLSPPAPHQPFTPAVRHRNAYNGVQAPRTPSFNVSSNATKHWLVRQAIHPIPDAVVSWIDETFRNRWRTLLAVDDLVSEVVGILASKKLLASTYVFFTSDNGYHLGQFSQPKDKRQPYETDIHVPLLVRGPGIPAGRVEQSIVLNIDLAPTFLDLAGLPSREDMDGTSFGSLLVHMRSGSTAPGRLSFLVEYTGEGKAQDLSQCHAPYGLASCDPQVQCECEDAWNNTFLCTRYIAPTANSKFCIFHDDEGFVESYNLANDPHELRNLFVQPGLCNEDVRESFKCIEQLSQCNGRECLMNCPPWIPATDIARESAASSGWS